ncbi:hypothetical protein AMTR_s00142p00045140 [Amborella trichopoda]|uniref:Uncharacterized protein n=1 Tax=Amborella trichopoda TaxID=13333 RepID=W1PEH0_AMBTC|nr:hypothetical protein AMTR_s00142p00045140 [Amborella trichopoda]
MMRGTHRTLTPSISNPHPLSLPPIAPNFLFETLLSLHPMAMPMAIDLSILATTNNFIKKKKSMKRKKRRRGRGRGRMRRRRI